MRLAAAATALAAAIAAPCARADDLSDLLDSAVALFAGGDGDVALHASVAAASDTDLNITAALTLVTGTGADLNVTLGLSADKCDTRNLQAAVAVDLISPDLVAQATCWLLSYGCDRAQVATNLFQHTYSVAASAPAGHGAGDGDLAPLQFVVDLYSAPAVDGNATTSADDGRVGVQLVLADVQPMFTGLSFRAELHGVAAAAVPSALLGDGDGNGAGCAALDAALLSLGVAEEDLGLDEGALCSFLAGSAREMLGLLGDVGLTTDPVNLGRVVASLLVAAGEPPLPWLDAADGSVTLGQNSALCQVTPDPFRVTFSDLGGATLNALLDGADDVVDALVAATNDCLSGDYAVTAANFEIDGAVELEPGDSGDAGGWALVGQLWGGGGKNPLGLFSCFADAFDGVAAVFVLPDGTPVTVDSVDVDGTDGECAGDDEYAQCAGAVPPAGSGMQTRPPETEPAGAAAGASADDAALTIGLAVCGTVVVVAVVVATAVVVARKSQLKQTRRVVRDALRAAQAPVVVAARVSGRGGRGGSATSSHSVGVRGQGAVARPEDVDPVVVKAEAV